MKNIVNTIVLTLVSLSLQAQQTEKTTKSTVDYVSFLKMSEEVLEYREKRLIPLDLFLEYLKDENTILLDTRSETAYHKKHLKGATHINFSDFTEGKLAEQIASKKTRVLIYCNNNIEGDPVNFASKMAPLALNIPTFINLYGYGYKNVYELSSLIPIMDSRLKFEGTFTE